MRVTFRTGAEWGDAGDQERVLRELAEGRREEVGGRREWAGNIELVQGRQDGEVVVSSTAVRDAVRAGDEEKLGALLSVGVKEWVSGEQLYLEND